MAAFSFPAGAETTPRFSIPPAEGEEGRTALTDAVPLSLTPADAELELHIRDCGLQIQFAMNRWAQTGCFSARGDADRWRLLMEAAIRSRSPDQVRFMEAERGLT